MGKLDKSKTSFDNLETQREEARLKELKLLRMDRLKTELGQMEQERQDYVDEIQTRTTSGTRFNPSKVRLYISNYGLIFNTADSRKKYSFL